MKKRFIQEKKGIISDYLPWLLIALAVLVILMIAIYFLSGNSFSLIDKIKLLFRK
ncbi:MAG: hypothetical protein ABIH28_02890 [archaeon]